MPLAREALRIATVRALRGRTLCGARVSDSEHGPVEDMAFQKLEPEIIVYTDDGKFAGEGRDLFAGGSTNLVLEIVITQRMKVKAAGGTGANAWEVIFPQTDSAMELTLGVIERQIMMALLDPKSAWAEFWKECAPTIGECSSQRGSAMREGVRFAGRQIIMPVTLIKDPTPGRPLGPFWTKFLALVDSTEDLAPIRQMMRALVQGDPNTWPEWTMLQSAYGFSAEETRALQLAPHPAAEESDAEFDGTVSIESAPATPQVGNP